MLTDNLNTARSLDLILFYRKKIICDLEDFWFAKEHAIKMLSETIEKYMNLAREQKNPWKMKVTVMPFVVVELGTVNKGRNKKLDYTEINERIKTRALLKSAHSEKSRKPEKTRGSGDFCEKQLVKNTFLKIFKNSSKNNQKSSRSIDSNMTFTDTKTSVNNDHNNKGSILNNKQIQHTANDSIVWTRP